MIKVDYSIIPSAIDEERYIGKTFTNNIGDVLNVLGIGGKTKKGIKQFVCEFKSGYRTLATAQQLNNGTLKDKSLNTYDKNEEYYKLQKSRQNFMDENRKLRKMVRDNNRSELRVEKMLEDLIESVKVYNPRELNVFSEQSSNYEVVLQLTDLHIGEVIAENFNEFTFKVARERMDKIFEGAIREASIYGARKITLAFTGDMINLDSHRDKKLTNEDVRPKALEFLFNDLLCPNIDKLLDKGFEIDIASIVGNEGRIDGNEYMTTVTSLAKDNYDYMVIILLKARYSNSINFHKDCGAVELVINVMGHDILLAHGNNFKQNKINEAIEVVKMRYFSTFKIDIKFVMLGHIHSSLVGDYFVRGAGLCGTNTYAFYGLGKAVNRPSQGLLVVCKDEIRAMLIKL